MNSQPPLRFALPAAVVAVAPFLDPRTWGAILYVWLGFPLGLAWFVGMTVGFLTGAALTIVWIGFLLLAVTLLAVWGAEGLERQLAIWLLGARVPPRLGRVEPATASVGLWGRARELATASALWKGMFFLALRFPLGLLGWIFSVVSLSISLAFLAAPLFFYLGDTDLHLGYGWIVDSPRGVWALAIAGWVGLVLSLHLHRALGWFWARAAELLLGQTETPPVAAREAAAALGA